MTRTIGSASRRVPGLRRVPVFVLVSAAQVMLITRDHLMRLKPAERRRLATLVRASHGRPSRLSASQRREFDRLVAKLEPRLLVGDAITRLSPVRLPRRMVYGRRTRR